MSMRVKLSQIIEGLEFVSEETNGYYDRRTGRIEMVTDDDLAAAEDEEAEDGAADWEVEQIDLARAILDDEEDRFVALPDRFEIDERSMMERFAQSVGNEAAGDELGGALKGRGAYRRFRDAVSQLGLLDRWYAYRDGAYRQCAIEWCERHQIEYEDDDRSRATKNT